MTRKQEGQRQIQKPRQGQGQKGKEQNINIHLSVCFSCSSLFNRTMNFQRDKQRAFLIIVADAADAVSVNISGRCKFLQI